MTGAADDTPAMATAATANLCDAHAEKIWSPTGGQRFTVTAATAGPACARAEATLIVRGADNAELLRFTALTEHIFDLREAVDSEAMAAALAAWIDQSQSQLGTTARLPEWPHGAGEPGGEFPFYPEERVSRAAYLAKRAANLPMFCFTQGLESLACYVLENGALERLGVQTFPG
ncbi:MAG: hypothetical protein AB7L65_04040 [Hyphomonadaceae bacterium]